MSAETQPLYKQCLTGVVTLALCMLAGSVSPAHAQPFSDKRGFGDTGGNYAWIQATNASWYHTWGGGLGNPGSYDALHIPMFRWWTNIEGHIDWALTRPEPTEWVMCFNEPERSDQDNLSVAEAISRYTIIVNGLAGSGIKIAGPGVSDDGAGQAWLASFMSQANTLGLQVDAVCFHWYGVSNPNDPIGAGNSFLSRVDSYHNAYGLPVWIPEFAIHDWGGAYTDEEIRAANATFLDYVIPRLESRSYVAGYAFYNWFGDSHLVEGDPLTPTNVGIPYVSVLNSGDTFDFNGFDFGERVAYLGGGELTLNTTLGQLKYLSALFGSSVISGSLDYALDDGWFRVQSGAVLNKQGSNQISLNSVDISNEGVINIADGSLLLESTSLVSGAGLIRVKPNGELAYYGRGSRTTLDYSVELAGGTLSRPSSGAFEIPAGMTLPAQGDVVGNLKVLSGGALQIGGDGLPSGVTLIDDFDAYDNSSNQNIGAHSNGDVTDGVWDGVFDGTNNGQILDSGRDNNVLTAWEIPSGGASGCHGAVTNLANNFATDLSLADGDTATYFFQIMNEGNASTDCMFGLTESLSSLDITDAWRDFCVMPYLAGSPGATDLKVYGANVGDVTLIDNITDGAWYNVWLVVNNASKTFDIYISTGTADGALQLANVSFGRITAPVNLDAFGIANHEEGHVSLDNLYKLSGENTTNPLAGGGVSYESESLTVQGDVTLDSGSKLYFDVANSGVNDVLDVSGNLAAGGTLNIHVAPSALTPQAGDSFALMNAATISGVFDDILFDTVLTPGELWDTRQLYDTGEISVVAAGDLLNANLACLNGPDNPLSSGCEAQDQDGDNDYDLHDYALLQDCVLDASGVIPAECQP